MGRRRRYGWHIKPETMRGIGVLFLVAAAGVLLLSLAQLAGTAGVYIVRYSELLFGWDDVLVPLVLLVAASASLYPDKNILSPSKSLGILLFFLSFNGLLNLAADATLTLSDRDLSQAGGIIGLLFARLFLNMLGVWGAGFLLLILTIVGVILTFNIPLRSVVDVPVKTMSALSRFSLRRKEAVDDAAVEEIADEDVEGVDDVEDVEAGEEEVPKAVSHAKEIAGLSEKALTTKTRREIKIPFDVLENRTNKANSGDIDRNKHIIQDTFHEFGMEVDMGDVSVGPTVTQYTMRPPRGVKVARILALHNDLALALAAHPIRIEAPIPGLSLVGIEVPNQTVATVGLRQLIETKQFAQGENLTFALGRDVSGKGWYAELNRMPHLLVAGATGSGKSVCLNAIIVSLLFAHGPDDLKFVMIDPKRVELTSYEGIPHLLIPPITKVEDAVNALKWTIREMERRLEVLSHMGTKDIKSFNARSKDRMPYIVVVIDELADLMMSSGREVESSIVRIAQLARATGIHLLLATQRPSVDVITGTIKANFPGRIAFAVASQTDSRTILDMAGAEKLLGRGDMLFTTAELSKPKRLQGAYISESEIEKIVQFLKNHGAPDYNYTITERTRSTTVFDGADEEEQIIDEAIQYILQAGKASTSMLQRRLKLGYSRAARLMDILEDKGIIGAQDGAKPREILIDHWPPENIGDTIPTAQKDVEGIEDVEDVEAAEGRPEAPEGSHEDEETLDEETDVEDNEPDDQPFYGGRQV